MSARRTHRFNPFRSAGIALAAAIMAILARTEHQALHFPVPPEHGVGLDATRIPDGGSESLSVRNGDTIASRES